MQKTTKYLSETHLDDIVHGVAQQLKNFGIEIDSDQMMGLNEAFTTVLNQTCQVQVVEKIDFWALKEEQWQIWFDAARENQTNKGLSQEMISPEETDAEAESLYHQFDGNIAAISTGTFKSKKNVPESSQMCSFQNATLQTLGDYACSIACYPNSLSTDLTQEQVVDELEKQLQPVISEGWSFDIQIGLDADRERNSFGLVIHHVDELGLNSEFSQKLVTDLIKKYEGTTLRLPHDQWIEGDARFDEGSFEGGFSNRDKFDPLIDTFLIEKFGLQKQGIHFSMGDQVETALCICIKVPNDDGIAYIEANYTEME
ncbi:hypothetical protein A1QO_04050 [Vibrio genomosp. F10 str. ZF-129]|uniref:Uncharacterized protein n=1 Tax=Vibrio genomosp. F10 str. ZF-129 TaxID=1187848 RepID=A0A1E5BIM3_9VIBR|nr:hypothetical protein [Vibrio genomosp. F10]OEE37284.1 hypothetical protein A1QO_04050 [Vibrio genomosp. F10 str. ZF-129]